MDRKMNFWEIFNKNYSRKAAVAVLAIGALSYIAISIIDQAATEAAEGIDLAVIKWTLTIIIIAIGLIAETNIIAQAINDWRNPQQEPEPPAEPETE